ncbi:hypothetical protein CSPX01_00100 [Colletotrichum filicis]|nr:hypothetical protein CSPX01_00100 [Colletotrichum filicis]
MTLEEVVSQLPIDDENLASMRFTMDCPVTDEHYVVSGVSPDQEEKFEAMKAFPENSTKGITEVCVIFETFVYITVEVFLTSYPDIEESS